MDALLQEPSLLAPAKLSPVDAVARRALQDRLVDVGDVLGVANPGPTGLEGPREHVENEERSGVTKVCRVVRRHAADVHRDDGSPGTERKGAAPSRVVKP